MLGNSMIVAGLIVTAFARNITTVFFSYSILTGELVYHAPGAATLLLTRACSGPT